MISDASYVYKIVYSGSACKLNKRAGFTVAAQPWLGYADRAGRPKRKSRLNGIRLPLRVL